MIESLHLVKYTTIGFAISYLSLEVVWHMTACGISHERTKPCLLKVVRNVVLGKVC